jgi:hypothetical protein
MQYNLQLLTFFLQDVASTTLEVMVVAQDAYGSVSIHLSCWIRICIWNSNLVPDPCRKTAQKFGKY